MEPGGDDEEPQICTVFSSVQSNQAKTIFDTIAFSVPSKDHSITSPKRNVNDVATSSSTISSVEALFQKASSDQRIPQSGIAISGSHFGESSSHVQPPSYTSAETSVPAAMFESLSMSYMAPGPLSFGQPETGSQAPSEYILSKPDNLMEAMVDDVAGVISKEIDSLSLNASSPLVSCAIENENEPNSVLPNANQLFANTPEVPFKVGNFGANIPRSNVTPSANVAEIDQTAPPIDTFSSITYSPLDTAYDAWIPSEQTRKVLMSIATAVHAGTYFPDKSIMTTPGIIYKEDLLDKVSVNVSRIFGEVEAAKRQILTADSVTNDDSGIRELIKLGCYRSAINLTKRLLTLHGQGPGKIGQFSKHTPYSLQLWMTRIALLVRIREFKIAESELEAFQNFENPDMFYEYYQDSYGQGRKGSMIPFYFRLLAAELPQYASKDHNGSVDKLNKLLMTIQQIIKNINEGTSEDGSAVTLDQERKDASFSIWSAREVRVYYSLTNAYLLSKDITNAVNQLHILREKDISKKSQLTSAIGRLYLQYGDLATCQKFFKEAASLRSDQVESERVENLVDAALLFIAQGNYAEAFAFLKEAVVVQPDNFMITNNMAVCLLYMGKVKESLALMETTMQNNKPQLLQENVILNLSTIYELENSDGVKKNALLKLISEYKGDGINLASLKMPNLI